MAAKIDRSSRNKLIALIAFLVVILIVVMALAIRDINSVDTRPAYESAPPPALREIGSVSIVDPERIQNPSTIADEDFIAFQRQARADFRTLGALSTDPATLAALRVVGPPAQRIAAQLAYGRSIVPNGSSGTLDGVAIDTTSAAGGTVTVTASYRGQGLNSETITLTFSLAYTRSPTGLQLSDVTVTRA